MRGDARGNGRLAEHSLFSLSGFFQARLGAVRRAGPAEPRHTPDRAEKRDTAQPCAPGAQPFGTR